MFAKKQQHCLNIQCAPGCCFQNFLKETKCNGQIHLLELFLAFIFGIDLAQPHEKILSKCNAHRLIAVPLGLFIEFLTIFKILFFLRIWSKLYWRFQQTLKMFSFPKFTQNCMNTATPNQGWVREDFQLPDVDLLTLSPTDNFGKTGCTPKKFWENFSQEFLLLKCIAQT